MYFSDSQVCGLLFSLFFSSQTQTCSSSLRLVSVCAGRSTSLEVDVQSYSLNQNRASDEIYQIKRIIKNNNF